MKVSLSAALGWMLAALWGASVLILEAMAFRGEDLGRSALVFLLFGASAAGTFWIYAKGDSLDKFFALFYTISIPLRFISFELLGQEMTYYPNETPYFSREFAVPVALASLLAVAGWIAGRGLFGLATGTRCDIKREMQELGGSGGMSSLVPFYVWYFMVSLIIHLLLTFKFSYYVAGVDTTLPFSGLVTYMLPVDFLLPIIVFFWMSGSAEGGTRKLLPLSLVLFVAVRMVQGWKGGMMDVAMLGLIVYLVRGDFKVRAKHMLLLLGLVVLYKVFSPLVTIVRLVWITNSSASDLFAVKYDWTSLLDWETILDIKSGSNLSLASRASAVDPFVLAYHCVQTLGTDALGAWDLAKTFLQGLVPGSTSSNYGFNRLFSIHYAGQDPEGVNEYGPGILGTGYVIGGYAGVFFFPLVFSFFYRSVGALLPLLRHKLIRIYLAVVLHMQIIGIINGGGIHSLHKLFIACAVLAALESGRRFAAYAAEVSVSAFALPGQNKGTPEAA